MTADHAENKSSILQIALNLAFACIISGIVIATVYFLTADIAKSKEAQLQQLALENLVKGPGYTYNKIKDKPGCYTVNQDDKIVAYIIPAVSKGYAGDVKLLVAVGPDNKVIKYTIIQSKETPGLGTKADPDDPKNTFDDQYAGKTSAKLVVTKDHPEVPDGIQAISGATITSRAITNAVKNAVGEASTITKGGK